VSYPRLSNLDEFQPLKNIPGLRLVWARSPAELAGVDWIVLPGSKHTSSDLAWLRAQGLDQSIAAHAGQGGTVLGVCGGLQMLGEALIDPEGIDGNAPGLGLLPLVTVFEPAKTVQRTSAAFGGAVRAASAASRTAFSGSLAKYAAAAAMFLALSTTPVKQRDATSGSGARRTTTNAMATRGRWCPGMHRRGRGRRWRRGMSVAHSASGAGAATTRGGGFRRRGLARVAPHLQPLFGTANQRS
jgi:putative intracellular protease/amidase